MDSEAIKELINNNMYDQKILSHLEDYVNHQYRFDQYDIVSYLHLLRIYALYPDSIKLEVIAKILVKALVNLPNTDVLSVTNLLPERLHAMEPIKTILKLVNLMETCQYKKFWKEAEQAKNVWEQCLNFETRIREAISLTVSHTYRSISLSLLKDYWNLYDKKAVDERIESLGWTRDSDGKTVLISANADNDLSHKPTIEQIHLEQMSRLLANFS